jgi:hypothetical protein
MKYSVSEKGIMKKALAVFLLAAWVLSITVPSLVCAQDGKAAAPSGKT